MNRAKPSSQRKQTACSDCHLTRDHSAATTRGVGVISPTRAVIRGTPSPISRSLSDIAFVTRRRRCDQTRGRRTGKTGGVFAGIH